MNSSIIVRGLGLKDNLSGGSGNLGSVFGESLAFPY